MSDIERELRTFVVTNFLFGRDTDTLTSETSFVDAGIVDSTGVLELIGFLEQQYQVVVEDEELVPANLDSLHRLAAFVERKRAAAGVAVDR